MGISKSTNKSKPGPHPSSKRHVPRAKRSEQVRKDKILKETKAAKHPSGQQPRRENQIDAELNQLRQYDDLDDEELLHMSDDDNEDDFVNEPTSLDAEDDIFVFDDSSNPTPNSKDHSGKVMPTPASRGVVFLGRIPHGFYEQEMRNYFTQFGEITRVRLSRNKTTGKSKHYAFIEFADPGVASIVATTMNGYIMFGQVLVCKQIPYEQIHPELFKGANRQFQLVNMAAKEMMIVNRPKSQDTILKHVKQLILSERARAAKLKALGIEYDCSEISFETLANRAGWLVDGIDPTAEPCAQEVDVPVDASVPSETLDGSVTVSSTVESSKGVVTKSNNKRHISTSEDATEPIKSKKKKLRSKKPE